MTEDEWLACRDPVAILKVSRSRLRHRKLRLFAVACCRYVWDALLDQRSRRAVEVAELYADARASEADLHAAAEAAHAAHRVSFLARGKRGACLEWAAAYAAAPVAFHAAKNVSWMSATAREAGQVTRADYATQAGLVRDIFRRPQSADPAWLRWRNGTVLRLAEALYEERALPSGVLDSARVGILADALEDASCGDIDILGHLRGSGPHCRGCWVIDLLLGKM